MFRTSVSVLDDIIVCHLYIRHRMSTSIATKKTMPNKESSYSNMMSMWKQMGSQWGPEHKP